MTLKDSIIFVDDKKYNLNDRMAMVFRLGAALANIFLRCHEIIWLGPNKFTAKNYKKTCRWCFSAFWKLKQLLQLVVYMKKQHANTKIWKENIKFLSSVYMKESFSDLYTNFASFILFEYKFGLFNTLFNCCFCVVSDFSQFSIEQTKLKKIPSLIASLQEYIDECILKLLNKVFEYKPKFTIVWEKELWIALPYLGNVSYIVKIKLKL